MVVGEVEDALVVEVGGVGLGVGVDAVFVSHEDMTMLFLNVFRYLAVLVVHVQ